MAVEDQPSFLQLRSHIGWPAPHMTDNPKAHGDPFAPEEIAATKEILGLPADQTFWVPEEVISYYRTAGARGRPERDSWAKHFDSRLPAGSQPRAAWDAQWRGDGLTGLRAEAADMEGGREASHQGGPQVLP